MTIETLDGGLARPEALLAEIAAGRSVVLLESHDPDSEGVVAVAARFATAEAITFMACHALGIIYLALTPERIATLGLPLMASRSSSSYYRPVTVSIEAREGVSTGISAADRARTIEVAIDPESGSGDIVAPGHIFPIAVFPNGVLDFGGYAEATVDMARLSGLDPSGVACKILAADGSTARREELIRFAALHGLKIGAVTDLIAHRRRTEAHLERVSVDTLVSEHGGEWTRTTYRDRIDGARDLVLTRGRTSGAWGAAVHVLSVADDVLGRPGRRRANESMAALVDAEAGVLIVVDEDRRTPASVVAAQVLADLGIEAVSPVSAGDAEIFAAAGVRIV